MKFLAQVHRLQHFSSPVQNTWPYFKILLTLSFHLFLLPVKESPNSCSNFSALSYVLRAWSSVILLFISRMLSMDLGLRNTATGCNWAIWRRLMALPLTSKIQCLPYENKKRNCYYIFSLSSSYDIDNITSTQLVHNPNYYCIETSIAYLPPSLQNSLYGSDVT